MKIALACDWLTNVGGAERVLLSLHELYPDAPIYTSQYDKKGIDWFQNADVRTGWLNIFPSRFRRALGPLRHLYFKHLDLSKYDVIISVTGAEAKAIKFNPATTRHICYCHVPTQYYWQMSDDYLADPGFGALNPLVRPFLRLFLKQLRRSDYRDAQRPTEFITISDYSKGLIKKYYHRDSRIICPPVAVEKISAHPAKPSSRSKDPYFIITARQVTWKRIDLGVKACLEAKQNLLIIGTGPEHRRLLRIAGNSPYIKFLPQMTQDELIPYLRSATAYIFPSLEPFGIAPVEALAAGCPVIAYRQGGSRDYIKDGKNGVLFSRQTVSSLKSAINKFSKLRFRRSTVVRSALPFSDARFKAEISAEVGGK